MTNKINPLIKNKRKAKRIKNLKIRNKIKVIRKLNKVKRLNLQKMIIRKVNKKIMNQLMDNKNQLNPYKMLMYKVLMKTVNNQQVKMLKIVMKINKKLNKVQNRHQTKTLNKMNQHHRTQITIKTKKLTHKMKLNLKPALQLNRTAINKNKQVPKTMDNNPKKNKLTKIATMKKLINKHYE